MATYEHVGFYNTPMDTKYYDTQRHLQLEAAVTELRDLLLEGYYGKKPGVNARLVKITEDLGLAPIKTERLIVDDMLDNFDRLHGPVTQIAGTAKPLARRFIKVGGKITANAVSTDAS